MDKKLHFGVCAAASIIHPWLGIGLAVGKEYGDEKAEENKWSWGDILADACGVVVGGAIRFGIIALWNNIISPALF